MKRIKVLCVDDDAFILTSLRRILGRRFDVVTSDCARAGLEIFSAQGPFDVVVSDMRMPGMDGATFLSLINSLDPSAKTILLTGQVRLNPDDPIPNLSLLTTFLEKPCEPEKLIEVISTSA